MFHNALRTGSISRWYLDIGCSRHMTGDRSLFSQLEETQDGSATFGDGNSTRIVGKGTIDISKHPKLNDVLYVQGLKHNLLSISKFVIEAMVFTLLRTNA